MNGYRDRGLLQMVAQLCPKVVVFPCGIQNIGSQSARITNVTFLNGKDAFTLANKTLANKRGE